MKLWLPIGIIGLLLAVSIFAIISYGKAKSREGYLSAINAQTNTDLQHLTAWATEQQKINQQVVDGLNGLSAYKETPLDPAIAASMRWVRDTRKPPQSKN